MQEETNRSPGRKKSRKICSVPQCSNYCGKGISLHKFPNDPNLRKQWQIRFKIGKKLSNNALACSVHFDDSCFCTLKGKSKKTRLKPDALPTLGLPIRRNDKIVLSPAKEKRKLRAERLVRRNLFIESYEMGKERIAQDDGYVNEPLPSEPSPSHLSPTGHNTMEIGPIDEKNHPNELEFDVAQILIQMSQVMKEDKATQTLETCFFLDLIESNDNLNSWTGISSFERLHCIARSAEFISLHYGYNVNFKLDITERIVMTMIKLKTALNNSNIASLFKISSQTYHNYFYPTIDLLYLVLQPFILFPSKESTNNNLPTCFLKFVNTRIVLDCSETPLEKVACLSCRIKTYSHYKGTHTIKFLIGVTPDGLISLVSKVYGGRASDKFIFNDTKIIDKLEPGDAVMVDKGFNIEKECSAKSVTLHKPPYLKRKKQFSAAEGSLNTDIAKARVHVERIMQRIKIFKIFTSALSWSLLSHIDKILYIICALVNLGKPIIGEKGFSL